ncbi:MAG: isoaspartyl peptidase/L-asparaginase [Candidatus Latescibacterota bacterium]|nr:MAG: isoaspartyl peptidase/L-asparaginase [Candidatus Latescibacterota bacterium]
MTRAKSSITGILLTLLISIGLFSCAPETQVPKEPVITMVIHGGAGTITRDKMTPEQEKAHVDKLTEALEAGMAILQNDGSCLDAVEAAIRILEDSPLFNAAKGAVFTAQGKNEHDASIMDGSTHSAGAVASVTTIKNPISAARAVMEHTGHVLLVGRGAEMFAASQGLDIVDPEYFFDQRRWDALLKVKEEEQSSLERPLKSAEKMGTVGALALDRHGNLAAGTSTGGLTNKKHGRVGDSPIIGAGNYANNATCAVSGTGQGEFFMRGLIAYDVSALMEYQKMSVTAAADKVIEKLTAAEGLGGLIALDAAGNVAMPFNTPGMYRGYVKNGGEVHVYLYGDDVE